MLCLFCSGTRVTRLICFGRSFELTRLVCIDCAAAGAANAYNGSGRPGAVERLYSLLLVALYRSAYPAAVIGCELILLCVRFRAHVAATYVWVIVRLQEMFFGAAVKHVLMLSILGSWGTLPAFVAATTVALPAGCNHLNCLCPCQLILLHSFAFFAMEHNGLGLIGRCVFQGVLTSAYLGYADRGSWHVSSDSCQPTPMQMAAVSVLCSFCDCV
jgi:hypothetical protein